MEITTLKNPSRTPYIYKVTNLETHQYYIGSQCSGKIVGMNYFTSSTNKEFLEGFKTHKEEKYKIEIIKEFEDPDECVRAENYIIRNYMLKKDGLCLNRACHCNGKKIFSRAGIPSPKKGSHLSEETRKKIGKANKGIPKSEKTKQKISETLQGHPSPTKGTHLSEETRKKIGKANKGIPRSEETRKRMNEAQKNRIKVSIEGTFFNSLTEASKYYKVSITAIRKWIKKNQHNAKKT